MSAVEAAAVDVEGYQRQQILLDGRRSGRATRFLWHLLDEAGEVEISDADQSVALFRAERAGTYRVKLTVADADGSDSSAIHIVRVKPASVVLEGPTTAIEKQPITVRAAAGDLPQDARFNWSAVMQDDGPSPLLSLSDHDTSLTVLPRAPGHLQIQVSVTITSSPGTAWATAALIVNVQAMPEEIVNPADAEWWQDKQQTDTRAALDNVRKAAATWQGFATGLLTLFSSVALLAGPKTFADTGNSTVNVIVLLTMAAALLLAGRGIWKLSRVNSSSPILGPGVSGPEYALQHVRATQDAEQQFRSSKRLTLGSAIVLGVGALGLSIYGAVEASRDLPTYVIVRTPSATLCGELSTDEKTRRIEVGGVAVKASENVSIVPNC